MHTRHAFMFALVGALILVAPTSHADQPLDALCGTTITANLTLTSDIDCTGYTGVALTVGADDITIDGAGFRLLAPDSSRAIAIVNRSRVTVRNIEVLGWCTGTGIHVEGGTGHLVEDVQADGRAYGVFAQATTNLTLRRITADSASTAGVSLSSMTSMPTLEGLRLTNSLVGLRLVNFTGPYTIDGTALADLSNSDTSIHFDGGVTQVTVADLTLDGATTGILASAGTNSNLTFRDLDLSARSGTGMGLHLGGSNHTVTRITANRRSTGVYLNTTTNVTVDTLYASGAASSGLGLQAPNLPLTLKNLHLVDNLNGLAIAAFTPASPYTFTAWDPATNTGAIAELSANDNGINVSTSRNLVFTGMAFSNLTGINASNASNQNLTFTNLDLSGRRPEGTGLYLGGTGHLVDNLIANDRVHGFYANTATNLTLKNVVARRNITNGVLIQNSILPLTLTNLVLEDNETALYLDGLNGPQGTPWRLGPYDPATQTGALASTTGSQVGVRIHNSKDLLVEDLVLRNRATGLYAEYANNVRLTIRDCDLSGDNAGGGIAISGNDHLLHDLIADGRVYGFSLNKARATTLRDSRARFATATALQLINYAAEDAPPVLLRLALTDGFRSVQVINFKRPFTFNPALALDFSGSTTGFYVDQSAQLVFEDLVIAASTFGIIFQRGNTGLVVRRCDLSGPGVGTGLQIGESAVAPSEYGGANHIIEDVIANNRGFGATIAAASNIRLTNFRSNGSGTGLYLVSFVPGISAPILEGVDLRDSASYALQLANITTPLVFDDTQGLDVTGSGTGIYLDRCVGLTFRNLDLKTYVNGLFIATDNRNIRAEGLDVSGYYGGYGVQVGYQIDVDPRFDGGPDHVLTGLIANHRTVGIRSINASNLTLTGVSARHNTVGLTLLALSGARIAPTLDGVDLSHNTTGLVLESILNPVTFDGADGNLTLVGNDTGISISKSRNQTFKNLVIDAWTYGIQGTADIRDLRFENLTLSGRGAGTGLSLGNGINQADTTQHAGPNHVILNVSANDFNLGLLVNQPTNLSVTDFRAARATSLAMRIANPVLPLTLTKLALTDSAIGLQLSPFAAPAATPFNLGPWVSATNTGAIASLAGCNRGLDLINTSNLVIHDLTITSRLNAIVAITGNSALTFRDLDLSGPGYGTGLHLSGPNHILTRVTASRRELGAHLVSTTNPTVTDLTVAAAATAALRLETTTLPVTLSGLRLTGSTLGLDINALSGAGSLALNSTSLASLAGNATAISLTSATAATVDTTGLGLVPAAGLYSAPAVVQSPLCGSTLTASLTLTADLDCSGTTGNVLTFGANDLTLDGAGFRIIAPHAANVVFSNGRDRLTIKNLDVSGNKPTGTGLYLTGGTGHRITDVTASRRNRGADIRNNTNLQLLRFTADQCSEIAVYLINQTLPLTLSGLSLTNAKGSGFRLDGLNGQGGGPTGGNFRLDNTVFTAISGNGNSIRLDNVSRVTVRQLVLDGLDQGLYLANSANNNVQIEDLDVTGRWSIGTGLWLSGTGHRVARITSNRRYSAVYASVGSDLAITDLVAQNSTYAGLVLAAFDLPIDLKNLRLTHSSSAIYVSEFEATAANPFVITRYQAATGLGAIADLTGSRIGLNFATASHILVRDVALPTTDYGVYALSGNSALRFEDLDISGPRAIGTGLYVAGADHRITRITGGPRDYGMRLVDTTNLSLSDIDVVRAGSYGIYFVAPGLPISLENLSARMSSNALGVVNAALTPANPIVIDGYDPLMGSGVLNSVAGSNSGVIVSDSRGVTVRDLTVSTRGLGIDVAGLTTTNILIEDVDVSNTYSQGIGLRIGGTGTVARRITSTRGSIGVQALDATNATIDDCAIDGSNSSAVSIVRPILPLTLKNLRLTNSVSGIELQGVNGTAAAPFVVDDWKPATQTGVVAHFAGNTRDIRLIIGNSYLTFRGLTTPARDYGVLATEQGLQNHHLTFEDLDVSGPGVGAGLSLEGADITVRRVTAARRGTGVYAIRASRLTIEDLVSRDSTYGLYLSNFETIHGPPTLSDIDLRNNLYGLGLYQWTQPFTIDATPGFDFEGSQTGIYLDTGTSNVTVRGLTLDNRTSGARANVGTTNLRFEDLDVSGANVGRGLDLLGTDHVVQNVTADRRQYGVLASPVPGLALTNVRARQCQLGLYLGGYTPATAVPVLDGVDVSDSSTGVQLVTWSTPFTIDPTSGIDFTGTGSGLLLYQPAEGITVEGLTLPSTSFGLYVVGANSRNHTLRDLDVSGVGRGRGLQIEGTDNIVQGITAHNRTHGVFVNGASNLTLTDVTAEHASSAALYLINMNGAITPPTLSGLRLTDSAIGIGVSTSSIPMLIDADAIADLSGHLTSVDVSQVRNLTLSGLRLDGRVAGVAATHPGNRDNRYQDLDATGFCRGHGLNLGGLGQTVDGVIGARRGSGIRVTTGNEITVTNSVMGASTNGVELVGVSGVINTTVVLDTTPTPNTASRFRVASTNNIYSGQTLRFAMPGGIEEVVASTVGSTHITVAPALSAIPPVDTVVTSQNQNPARLSVTSSDICANGTGWAASAITSTATDNYWRSSSGPRHSGNPTGTGDLVTATATTYGSWETVPTDKLNPYCNQPPVADGGPARQVCEGDTTTLDASASTDPDIEPLLFLWEQTGGTTAQVANANTSIATVTAPEPKTGGVASNSETLDFRVKVSDDYVSRTATTTVTVTRRNDAPVANAGPDASVAELALLTLSGASSNDPEAQTLSYAWTQTAGPAVVLTGATTAAPSFTAPAVTPGGGPLTVSLTFRLTVTDVAKPTHCGGALSHSDTVTITVTNVDRAPIANAGPDQRVNDLITVSLDGRASSDPDGDALTFVWTQTAGPAVVLTGATTSTPTFTSPDLAPLAEATLTFRLTVNDGFGKTATDTVSIVVVGVCPDTDGDGTIDCDDDCPNDPTQVTPGPCGCAPHPGCTVCDEDTDCVDSNECTAQICDEGRCTFPALPEGTPCSVGTCNGIDGNATCTPDDGTFVIISTPEEGEVSATADVDVTGLGEPGATIVVSASFVTSSMEQTQTTTVAADGTWAVILTDLADGAWTVVADATDTFGNIADDGPVGFEVDTTTFVIIEGPQDGLITTDGLVDISGISEVGATVTVTLNGVTLGTAVVGADGTWVIPQAGDLSDGDYLIAAVAVDRVGNIATDTGVTFTVDSAEATITITTPTEGAVISNATPMLGADTQVDATATLWLWTAAGAFIGTWTPGLDAAGHLEVQAPTLADGAYRLEAKTTRPNGLMASDESTFIVDTTLPAIDILVPVEDAMLADPMVTVSGTTEPNLVVEVFIDDVSVGTTTADGEGAWALVLEEPLAEGPHVARAHTSDAAGNEAQDTTNFTIDLSGPAIVITTPEDGDVFTVRTVVIGGTTEPNAEVEVTLTDANGDVVETWTVTADIEGSWSVTAEGLDDGPYVASAEATDEAGNSASAVPVGFVVDSTAPTLHIDYPTQGLVTNDTTPPVTGGTDVGNTVVLTIVDSAGTVIATASPTVDAEGNFTWDVDPALDDGDYTAHAVATDPNGLTTEDSVDFTVDTTTYVTITTPADGEETEDVRPPLTGTAEAGATVVVSIDDVVVGTVVADAEGTWEVTLTNDLTYGQHTAKAVATDAANNTAEATSTFTVLQPVGPEPQPEAVEPQPEAVEPQPEPVVEGGYVASGGGGCGAGGLGHGLWLVLLLVPVLRRRRAVAARRA